MTKGILCTIDFSEASKEALRWSVSLAETLHSHLTILYTYRLFNSTGGDASDLKKRIESEANQQFSGFEKELLTGKKISYDFKVEVGFISNRVKDFSKKHELGFLVVGDRKRANNHETIEDLVKEIQVPLVILP